MHSRQRAIQLRCQADQWLAWKDGLALRFVLSIHEMATWLFKADWRGDHLFWPKVVKSKWSYLMLVNWILNSLSQRSCLTRHIYWSWTDNPCALYVWQTRCWPQLTDVSWRAGSVCPEKILFSLPPKSSGKRNKTKWKLRHWKQKRTKAKWILPKLCKKLSGS